MFVVTALIIGQDVKGQDVKKDEPKNQEPPKAQFPRNGIVTGDKVNLRCGPGENFRVMTMLKKDEKLTVVKVEGDWCAVVPPSGYGIFFLIHKRYVNKGASVGDGFEGEVVGDNVIVRSGDEDKGDAPVGKLNKGDKVIIIGDVGPWFKIKPPEGMYLWVSAKFVKLEAAEEKRNGNESETPKPLEPTEREKELEKKMEELRKKLDELTAMYNEIKSERDKILKEKQERENAIAEMERKMKELEEGKRRAEKELSEKAEIIEKMYREPKQREAKYTAIGIVQDYGPYIKGPEGTTHKLLETSEGPVKYYLKAARSEIKLDDYLFKQVGIIGTVKKTTGYDAPILEVERIEILTK
jgi:uncharacterized protein YgiM (DUF1202 family)